MPKTITQKPSPLLLVVILWFLCPMAFGQGGTGKEATPTPSPTPRKTTPAKGNNPQRPTGPGKPASNEIAFWESIKDSTDPEDFKAYLQQYPNGTFVTLARNRLKKLEAEGPKPASTPAPSPGKSGINSSQNSNPGTVVRNKIGMELVWIPPGVYIMGSTNGRLDEKPLHPVAINYSFLMGKYEVTQAQWQQLMGTTVRDQRDKSNRTFWVRGEGGTNPMQYVNWNEAQQFIQKLNEMNDGYVYRLPTEEEWEYACRAGTTGDYAGVRDEMAWFADNAGDQPVDANKIWNDDRNNYGQRLVNNGNRTHPVGMKKTNAFGLYDMHGNVSEWCQDWYHDSYNAAPTDGSAWVNGGGMYRVARGGSWFNAAMDVRSSDRFSFKPDTRMNTLGFRVVATVRSGSGTKLGGEPLETASSSTLPTTNSSPGTSPKSGAPAGLPKIMRNRSGIDFVWIPSGNFTMGSPSGNANERPTHQVTLNYSFYIGKYEVTQAQWQAVMANNPSDFKDCGNCPVDSVSWEDAQSFMRKLNQMNDGYTYRLPTEAEWEYASRAGTTADVPVDNIEMAWYSENSGGKTHPAGQRRPNAWGLSDIHGNVWEWCEDWYHETYDGAPTDGKPWLTGGEQKFRVLRGGSWSYGLPSVRSANRGHATPGYHPNFYGFRVVAVARTQ